MMMRKPSMLKAFSVTCNLLRHLLAPYIHYIFTAARNKAPVSPTHTSYFLLQDLRHLLALDNKHISGNRKKGNRISVDNYEYRINKITSDKIIWKCLKKDTIFNKQRVICKAKLWTDISNNNIQAFGTHTCPN
jgi:hypothetical protein